MWWDTVGAVPAPRTAGTVRSLPPLCKALREVMGEALKGADARHRHDPLDDIRARRDAKRQSIPRRAEALNLGTLRGGYSGPANEPCG